MAGFISTSYYNYINATHTNNLHFDANTQYINTFLKENDINLNIIKFDDKSFLIRNNVYSDYYYEIFITIEQDMYKTIVYRSVIRNDDSIASTCHLFGHYILEVLKQKLNNFEIIPQYKLDKLLDNLVKF
jgi:hypothetical protein